MVNCKNKNLLVVIVMFIGLLPMFVSATSKPKAVPTGSPMADSIQYQFAVYFLPRSVKDPHAILKQQMNRQQSTFQLVDQLPDVATVPVVQAIVENDVQKQYSPPTLDAIKYSARGLSKAQAEQLQQSQQALILNFAYPRQYVWVGLREATSLLEGIARQSGGMLWDEMTRQVFTPDEWHKHRLTDWHKGVPVISSHMTIHAYKDDEFIRAISLGMQKFGLPDVVVDNFSWSMNRSMGNIINLFTQAMAEGATFNKVGEFDLNIKAIIHPTVRDSHIESLSENATGVARLSFQQGVWEEGDPYNRLIHITFNRYDGNDEHARQDAMITSLFGAEDSVSYISHNDELLVASKRAKGKLPALRNTFNAGLQPGEFIQVKAPFATPDGGNEWMWVEISHWSASTIKGLLKNEPYHIPDLHAGQMVTIKQQDVFDYIRQYPDGTREGNETGVIIQKMQAQ